MGEGSFDKERFSKPGRIFHGTRIPENKGGFSVGRPVGNASRNHHQREAHKKQKDLKSTRRLWENK